MTFPEFIRSCGVLPPKEIIPGLWVRAATQRKPLKKNASVKLAEDLRVGWVQNFESGGQAQVWKQKENKEGEEMSPEDYRAMQEARRKEIDRLHVESTARALRHWQKNTFPLEKTHPYLEGKDLTMLGCAGLRVDDLDNLVVPMMVKGKLSSLQTIAADGSKKFWYGAPTKGTHYVIGETAPITIFCEGLATGLTIYEAFETRARVIICFNAQNLGHVVRKCRGITIIAADNDHQTEKEIGKNPGVEAARLAAEKHDCRLSIPEGDGTDFNDLFSQRLVYWSAKELGSFKKGPAFVRKKALADVKTQVLKFV